MQYKLLKDLPGIKAGTVLDIEKVWKFCSIIPESEYVVIHTFGEPDYIITLK